MEKYELTFLLRKSDDAEKIKKLLASEGGKIIKEEKWGEKTLAYPIKKSNTAFYFSYILEMPKDKIASLRKKLNFEEKILRYLLLVS